MKRNHSMPKMSMLEISNRLNRLKAKNRSRLQFPKYIEQKKHYFQSPSDQVVLGSDNKSTPKLQQHRNNMDISDIQGTKPKVIEKQRNVMNYYKSKDQEYNPFAPKRTIVLRTNSDSKIYTPISYNQFGVKDSLDVFQRELQRKLVLNPENKRQITQPTNARNNIDDNLRKKQVIQKDNSHFLNKNIHKPNGSGYERKSLVYNPTFVSQLFLY